MDIAVIGEDRSATLKLRQDLFNEIARSNSNTLLAEIHMLPDTGLWTEIKTSYVDITNPSKNKIVSIFDKVDFYLLIGLEDLYPKNSDIRTDKIIRDFFHTSGQPYSVIYPRGEEAISASLLAIIKYISKRKIFYTDEDIKWGSNCGSCGESKFETLIFSNLINS